MDQKQQHHQGKKHYREGANNTFKFNHYLFPIDFSACSQYALEWSLSHLHFYFCANNHNNSEAPQQEEQEADTITLLHIVEKPKSISSRQDFPAEAMVDQARQQMVRLWQLMESKYHIHPVKPVDQKYCGDCDCRHSTEPGSHTYNHPTTSTHNNHSQKKVLNVQIEVEVGDPKECLQHYSNGSSNSHPVSMIIMGNHGKSGSAREVGSVSDHCLRKCSVPVIIVKEPSSPSH